MATPLQTTEDDLQFRDLVVLTYACSSFSFILERVLSLFYSWQEAIVILLGFQSCVLFCTFTM